AGVGTPRRRLLLDTDAASAWGGFDRDAGSSVRDDLAPGNGERDDLAVVVISPAVLQGIEQGFGKVVEVATTVVGRKNVDLHVEWAAQGLGPPGSQQRTDLFAKGTPRAADPGSMP